MKNERTSKRVAKIAGRVLQIKREPAPNEWSPSWADIRALAASALTQSPDHSKDKVVRKGRWRTRNPKGRQRRVMA